MSRTLLPALGFALITAACGPTSVSDGSASSSSNTTFGFGAAGGPSTGSSGSNGAIGSSGTTMVHLTTSTGNNANAAGNTGTTGANGNNNAAATGNATNAGPTGGNIGNASSTSGGTTGSCPGYAEPNTPASCTCGKSGSCSANNCYGGWFCDLSDDKCVAPPAECGGTTSATTTGAVASSTGGFNSTTTGAAATTGTTGTSGSCPGYAEPNTPASCHCGKAGSCSANNCYGGYYCELSDLKCVPAPTTCASGTTSGPTTTTTGNANTATTGNAGTTGTTGTTATTAGTGTTGGTGTTTFTSNITASGGTESNLYFAALGDCRPENMDDTANYPTATITQIYKDIQALNPRPPFTISTGDYMYCSNSDCTTQAGYYETAVKGYSGIEFAGMGNHECTGYTDSNCGASGADGITPNYTAFMNTMMTPIGQTNPYYAINISDTNGKWTAKFVMIAANAWDTTQSSWLDSVMSKATTYTFVERHEPTGLSGGPPGLTASESILASYHITLKLVGHTHEYQQVSGANPPEVIIGNGGVPGTTGPFGYALIEAQSTGEVKVTEMDASSNAALGSFTVSP